MKSSHSSTNENATPMGHVGSFEGTHDLQTPLLHTTPETFTSISTPASSTSTSSPSHPYPHLSPSNESSPNQTEHVVIVKPDNDTAQSVASTSADDTKKKSLKKKKPQGPLLTEKDKQKMQRDIVLLGWARNIAIVFTMVSVVCQLLVFCWHVARHHGLREIKELYSPSIRLLALYSICRLSGKYQRIITKRMSKTYAVICEEVASSCFYRAGSQYGEQIIFAILTCGFTSLNLIEHLISSPHHYELWQVLVQYAVPVAIDLAILVPIHFYIQHIRIHYIAKHSDTN